MIARRGESGETVREFCGANGVSTASFYAWKRKLREDGGDEKCGAGEQNLFTPVTVVGRLTAAIEVEFRSGAIMRLPTDDDTKAAKLLALV